MSQIKITELDFLEIKENLKTFLKQQEEFKDYDFSGSGLQVLLDILSSNTYYNSIYQNMVINESFLDSSILRESVVSKAKALGYTPRSKKCSEATITLSLVENISNNSTPTQPEYIILPEYSVFTSSFENSSYVFTNTESKFLVASSTYTDTSGVSRKIYRGTFEIFQGIKNQQVFDIDYQGNPDQRFVIENEDVDTDTLIVKVKEDQSTDQMIYSLAENVSEIGSDDRVYWIIENEKGKYEIEFGNGRIGKKLLDSSEVQIEYLITEGSLCNNFKNFGYGSSVVVQNPIDSSKSASFSIFSLTTESESFGGDEKETEEEIKFSAPKNYESQNRAVTSSDYRFLVENKYKFIDSVKTWGGEDNDPPEYGKVFLSLKPKTGYFITDITKENIKNDVLKDYNVVSIVPEIVDPFFTKIILNSEVKYNLGESPYGENYVKDLIISNLLTYDSQNLQKFDSYFRFSKLIYLIDSSHDSIKSNISSIEIQNEVSIFLDENGSYYSNFNNSLLEGSLSTNKFKFMGVEECFMEDFGGKIDIMYYDSGVKKTLKSKVGSVDYISGKVSLSNLKFESSQIYSYTNSLELKFKPLSSDLTPFNNQIFILDFDNLHLQMKNISNQFLKG